MSENEPPRELRCNSIVMPWCDLVQEEILRIHGGSFTVAWGWSIAWSGTGWQVFFQGVCADELTREHETFRAAYDSIERRYDAKLATAIDAACRVLPSDCEIIVRLNQGSAVVSLLVDGEDVEFSSNLETLAQTIEDALLAAQDLNG